MATAYALASALRSSGDQLLPLPRSTTAAAAVAGRVGVAAAVGGAAAEADAGVIADAAAAGAAAVAAADGAADDPAIVDGDDAPSIPAGVVVAADTDYTAESAGTAAGVVRTVAGVGHMDEVAAATASATASSLLRAFAAAL